MTLVVSTQYEIITDGGRRSQGQSPCPVCLKSDVLPGVVNDQCFCYRRLQLLRRRGFLLESIENREAVSNSLRSFSPFPVSPWAGQRSVHFELFVRFCFCVDFDSKSDEEARFFLSFCVHERLRRTGVASQEDGRDEFLVATKTASPTRKSRGIGVEIEQLCRKIRSRFRSDRPRKEFPVKVVAEKYNERINSPTNPPYRLDII